MIALQNYIIEKMVYNKANTNNKPINDLSYKTIIDELYKNVKNFGLCIVTENKYSHATYIYSIYEELNYNNYKDAIEDIYSLEPMLKTKIIYLYPLVDKQPLYDYVIFSSKWINTEKEFNRDYFEKIFF